MGRILDKKAFWSDLVDDLYDQVGTGFYFMLKTDAYIDRIEHNKVVIACRTESLKSKIEQKYIKAVLKAFTKSLARDITIILVHGPARIFHKLKYADESPEIRYERLFRGHGHLMGIIANDPIFKEVCLPLEEGGWGIFPEKLTNACRDYGIIAIQDALVKIADTPNIFNARGYFDAHLKLGNFGPKLEKSVDILGLRWINGALLTAEEAENPVSPLVFSSDGLIDKLIKGIDNNSHSATKYSTL